MSWIDKELKRRAAASRRSAPRQSSTISTANRIRELWDKLERANAALPSELQLSLEQGDTALSWQERQDEATFAAWLRARNKAALGFATEGIRYVWPETGRRRSHNFWIRWDPGQARYLLSLRVGTSVPAPIASYALDDTRIDYMIKRLVMGKRIRIGAIRKKRLWFF